jgi:hypothetical protein
MCQALTVAGIEGRPSDHALADYLDQVADHERGSKSDGEPVLASPVEVERREPDKEEGREATITVRTSGREDSVTTS